ncbi:MAG: ATP-binding protein [Solirubrobacteraceae bacterium]|nr:ATP-binding protein [Patulibacter sp.]
MAQVGDLDYRALFEALPNLYMVLDPDYRLVTVTDAYAEATLVQREEVVGRHLFEVFPDNPDDESADGVGNLRASLDRVMRTREPDTMAVQKYDVEEPGQPGVFRAKYWTPVNTPILGDDGRVKLIVHRVEDATEWVEMQQAAEAEAADSDAAADARAELRRDARIESEILRRANELGMSVSQLRAANEAKNEFLSRMSHELRTPLAAILGFSELLTLADLSPEHDEWSSMILRAGRHLLNLVNEVLDISRIESGDLALSMEPIAISPLLDEAYELVAPLATGRGVELHAPQIAAGAGYSVADAQRLKQVVVNLLSNAVKYNREHGAIHVAVALVPGNRVRVEVTDTGEGISEASLGKLFVPFERLDAGSTSVEGTGLGLALSRALVETMGGQLTASSVVGTGSTFAIELDLGEPVAVEEIEAEHGSVLAPLAYETERTLLYIEDTLANLRLVEQILLARTSVKVLPAMLGSLGIDLAREHQPDAILLDLHLPDLGGDEVLARLRADERTHEIPVVILSADATGRSVEPLKAAGAHDFLTKPIAVRELLTVVDELIGDGVPAEA